jgi:hypothetical protein
MLWGRKRQCMSNCYTAQGHTAMASFLSASRVC